MLVSCTVPPWRSWEYPNAPKLVLEKCTSLCASQDPVKILVCRPEEEPLIVLVDREDLLEAVQRMP